MKAAATEPKAVLSTIEKRRLSTLEEIIEGGVRSFFEVGNALAEIRAGKLYRATFQSFEDYTKARWDLGKSHTYRILCACEIRQELSPLGDILPETERQVRPLVKLKPVERAKVWKLVVKNAPEVDGAKHITARLISQVVRELEQDTFRKKEIAELDGESAPEPEEELSLAVALSRLNKAVMDLRGMWPKDEIGTMVAKLRKLAEQIQEESDAEGRRGESAA